jgi:hypothetical protein
MGDFGLVPVVSYKCNFASGLSFEDLHYFRQTENMRIAIVVLALSMLTCSAQFSAGAFDTIINVGLAGKPVPSSIGSNTQLNVFGGASLPDGFQAGNPNGTSTNVELNFSGHRTGSIRAYAGSVVNLSAGTVWGYLTPYAGSIVNISGDVTFLSSFDAQQRSTVNIYGGSVHEYTSALDGGRINVRGGTIVSEFDARAGGIVELSGGTMGDGTYFRAGSELRILGDHFRINGLELNTIVPPGTSLQIDLPENALLSGVLADGTPFAMSGQDGDQIADGSLILSRVTVPSADPIFHFVQNASTLGGLRRGQHLTLQDGGVLRNRFNAETGSTVLIEDGSVGNFFEASGARVIVNDGTVGESFDAMYGSVVSIYGGEIAANFDALNGSIVEILSGHVGPYFNAHAGSRVMISGGTFEKAFEALQGSSVIIRGGEFAERFYVRNESTVTIAGGNFGDNFRAYDGSIINFRGTEFQLDGVPIEGLVAGTPLKITDRDVTLSGLIADGSPFSFELGSTDYDQIWRPFPIPYDFFSPGSTLCVTLVPEPRLTPLVMIIFVIKSRAVNRRPS